jgi:hypothetical protein
LATRRKLDMANSEQGSNSVAIVALVVAGILVAGGGILFFTGAIGGGTAASGDTIIIERSEKTDETGYSFKYEDKDGTKGEVKTPSP